MAAREMKQEPKTEIGGRGRGRKETLADKPPDFENLCSPANAVPDWLGYSNNVDMCQSKVCFILRGGMVRDTYINFQWLLFILVGKICPPMQEHFLSPLLKCKALLATK